MRHIETLSVKQRLCAAITAATLAASTMGAPFVAFADPVSASAGAQTGTGATDVYVQLQESAADLGGSEDAGNTDGDDEDKYGDNIAFSVPASINFVAKPNGDLIGPKAAATYIENQSVFAIHASSVQVTADSNWNLVEDAKASGTTESNSVSFTFGPAGDELNAAKYTMKQAVNKKDKWQMSYAKASESDTSDRVRLTTKGHIANVDANIKDRAKIATIRTYVTQGPAPTASTGE